MYPDPDPRSSSSARPPARPPAHVHTGFTEYTCKPHNLETARVAGKAVAMTTLDMLCSPGLMEAARGDWEASQGRRDWTVELAM